MSAPSNEFRLAPMSGLIRGITYGMFVLPIAFIGSAVRWGVPHLSVGLLLVALYLWVWLRMRPGRFVVHPDAIEVIWPLKRRRIARAGVTGVRLVSATALRAMTGAAARVGVGGLWGGFGWLWTKRRGIVQMYVSRGTGLVWVEQAAGRPWLITPEAPEAFVRAAAPDRALSEAAC